MTRDVESEGPQFGPEGLIIRMTPGKEQTARSRLGAYYEERPDGTQHLFTDAENVKARGGKLKGDAQLLRLRAFVAEGDGEKWELDGVVWKTST